MNATFYLTFGSDTTIQQLDVPLPDIKEIHTKLVSHRAGVYAAFDAFVHVWETQYKSKLSLSAALVQLRPDFLTNKFLPSLTVDKRNVFPAAEIKKSFYAVWTLGTELDLLSDELVRNNLLWAFFLDIAATKILIHFHQKLIKMLNAELCQTQEIVAGEYYPGCGETEMELVTHIIDAIVQTGLPLIDTKQGLPQPKKTQCALLFCGSASAKLNFPKIPCGICLAKQCTYYQLGACHMGSNWQETKES